MAERPQNVHTSKSFTRLEPQRTASPASRSRASTLQGPSIDPLNPLKISLSSQDDHGHADGDVFETKEDNNDEDDAHSEYSVPDRFEELPIEIRSLTERSGSIAQD